MLTKSSAHVHTQYCDGRSTAEEMVRAALALGLVNLGFSSHAPQTFGRPCCVLPAEMPAYRREIQRLKTACAGRLAIYTGLEVDYFACEPPTGCDYFIASVHYMPEGHTPVDGKPEELRAYIDHYCGGNGMELAKRYFELLVKHTTQCRPDIIGHFDLLRKNNARLHFLDEESPAYRRLALDALSALRPIGALLEVNTGAMARGVLSTPYPAAFLLRAWRDMDGEVMVNSDCHFADKLAYGYDEAEALLRASGFDHAYRLGRGNEKWVAYSLIA